MVQLVRYTDTTGLPFTSLYIFRVPMEICWHLFKRFTRQCLHAGHTAHTLRRKRRGGTPEVEIRREMTTHLKGRSIHLIWSRKNGVVLGLQ